MASNQGLGPMPRAPRPANKNYLPGKAPWQPVTASAAPTREFIAPVETFPEPLPAPIGCVFAKSCNLPNSVIDYRSPLGFVPTDSLKAYGDLVLLGGREVDESGRMPLKKISGTALPVGIGGLALSGTALGSLSGVASGLLVGLVALVWPSNLGDSALYTEDQLQTLKKARTRMRLHVEQQTDGTLKGYGYYTGTHRNWEMIDVIQFQPRGTQQVADFGDGVELIWTPAVNPGDTLGIPTLEAAPQAPQIWIFPPTDQADKIIVDPIHPPDYRDFILVFPADSGIKPLYIVMNVRLDPGVVTGRGQDVDGLWLAGAGVGLGVPIPTRIADQLRGKSFGSFDAFRTAFWKAVAVDSEFGRQFNSENTDRMYDGFSPKTRRQDHVGKRRAFELHHIDLVSEGGAVYNVDNLRVTTPKNHIDIHRR